jgi:hypothetical protein
MQLIRFPPPADFVDRTGVIREIPTCSLVGRLEFFPRLEAIKQRLEQSDPNDTWESLYYLDIEFRHHIDTCLKLNGIDPDWLTPDMAAAFLMGRYDVDAQDFVQGWLVQLNTPKTPPKGTAGGEGEDATTVGALLALAKSYTPDITDAIKLINDIPAEIALDFMHSSNQIAKDADPNNKKRRRIKGKKPSAEELTAMLEA